MLIIFVALFVFRGCGPQPAPPKSPTHTVQSDVPAPAFNADSCFSFVKTQVDFGPRIPNSRAHESCGNWMVEKLRQYGAKIIEQKGTARTWERKEIPLRNIIAEFNPSASKRILLAAHWDTRPYADKDSSQNMQKKPIDGANDGGSGVGVLIELARMIHSNPLEIGIDMLFFDAEDMGKPEWEKDEESDIYTWCLGSQYWVKNPHKAGYQPMYGILLDMVGAADARFNKEGVSMNSAPDVVNMVWKKAQKIGYGEYFQDQETGEIIDDHVFLNIAGYRTIDIIDMRPSTLTMGFGGFQFGSFHHTHKDNINVIDRKTLKAVGQTLSQVIYNVK
ncbi:MAG: M28 family peptidase [Crocinitomicaceae bacterium]|nr:M28 family peptidase [Crocinitomicaceae bacterium]